MSSLRLASRIRGILHFLDGCLSSALEILAEGPSELVSTRPINRTWLQIELLVSAAVENQGHGCQPLLRFLYAVELRFRLLLRLSLSLSLSLHISMPCWTSAFRVISCARSRPTTSLRLLETTIVVEKDIVCPQCMSVSTLDRTESIETHRLQGSP